MANLKEVRNRIVSVSSTQQITSAMKMVSAAKLRRAQDAVVQMRPYANKLKEILENLSSSLDSTSGIYSRQNEVKKVLIVPITSNRGLCGGFNANVIKTTIRVIKEEYSKAEVNVLPIGRKATDFFKKSKIEAITAELTNLTEVWDELTFSNTSIIAEKLMHLFAANKYDKIELVYNHFKNAAVQELLVEQYLPVKPAQISEKKQLTDYILEPSKQYIVEDLIPRSLKTQFFKALLDSMASEHGARMTAMHKATDNAGALIKELKLSYNKARQAAITGEILEIVGGAEALKG